MSAVIDFSTLTLNAEEARTSNEMVFETAFLKPNSLADVHDIQTGVDTDRWIPILGKLGLVGKTDPGDCTSNVETSQVPVSQKKWEPELISFRLGHCQADIPNLLKVWKKSMIAAGTWEDIDDEMVAFIEQRALDATMESIYRLSSFGDKDASAVGSGAGSEVLTAGVDADYFNSINGLWKQVFTDQAGAAAIYRHTILENGGATKALQLALAADTTINAMRDLFDNISAEAFADGGLEFQMTRSMHTNYVAFLEDKSLAFTLQRAEEGKALKWSYRGIPITIRYDWDRNIRAYHDLGATYYLPHRIILSRLSNIPIGTSDEQSMSEFRSFYDFKDKKHYIDVAYKLDMKILLESEIAVAY